MTEVKARQLLKLLKKSGYSETRVTGDHHRFTNEQGRKVTINYRNPGDTIKKGTLAAIYRQAGLKGDL